MTSQLHTGNGRSPVLLAIGAAMLLIAGACVAGSPPETSPMPGQQSTVPAASGSPLPPTDRVHASLLDLSLAPEGESIFEQLLSAVPDTPETRAGLAVDDFETLRGQRGIAPPGPEADRESVLDYLRAVMGPFDAETSTPPDFMASAWLFGIHQSRGQIEIYPYLAMDDRNVDQIVVAGLEPRAIEIARGRFDPGLTDDTLRGCQECQQPEVQGYSGESFYSWGEDFQANLRLSHQPPAFDHIGRGGRIRVTDEYVVRTLHTDGMHQAIDVRLGNAPSLAQAEDFVLAARAMGALGAYSAAFSDADTDIETVLESLMPFFRSTEGMTEERFREVIVGEALMLPYALAAAGGALGDSGPFVALALVHDDEAAATENVHRLVSRLDEIGLRWVDEQWADRVERVEVTSDGRVLMARLYGDGLRAWRLVPTPALASFLGGHIFGTMLAHE